MVAVDDNGGTAIKRSSVGPNAVNDGTRWQVGERLREGCNRAIRVLNDNCCLGVFTRVEGCGGVIQVIWSRRSSSTSLSKFAGRMAQTD